MNNHMLKIIVAGVLFFGLASISATNADFVDSETPKENIYSAGSLVFSLTDSSNVILPSPLFSISDMKPGDNDTKTVRIHTEGSLDFQYKIRMEKTSGDDVLCNALQIETFLDGVGQYDGSLIGLALNPAGTLSGISDDWAFTVRLDDSTPGLQNKTCAFDLRIQARQLGSDGSWGFTDENILSNSVSSGTWVSTLSSPFMPFLYVEDVVKPEITLTLSENKKSASFTVTGIEKYETLSYELTYDTDIKPQGIKGETAVDGKSEFSKSDLPLGTNSTGEFVYHTGVKNMKLTVTLTTIDGGQTVLEQSL